MVENGIKKLTLCGFCLKYLAIEVLNRPPRDLWGNVWLFCYIAIYHVIVRKCFNVNFPHYVSIWKHLGDHYKIFIPTYSWFPIKIFANNIADLNQQLPGKTNHVHYFQAQLTKNCLVVWFWVDKRLFCCFFLYKK